LYAIHSLRSLTFQGKTRSPRGNPPSFSLKCTRLRYFGFQEMKQLYRSKIMCLKEINKKLEKIAFNKTIPFCYSCYKEAPTGACKTCHSDDLMRLLPEYGCEYGTDWVIKNILEENLETVDITESFEQMIEDCYGETTKVRFLEVLTVDVMKEQDPIAWDIAKSEYMDGLEQDDQVITFDNGSNYYWLKDLEIFIEDNLEAYDAI